MRWQRLNRFRRMLITRRDDGYFEDIPKLDLLSQVVSQLVRELHDSAIVAATTRFD